MSDIFFDAVTCIREDLIEEAQNYVFRRRQVWKRQVGLAAGFLIAVCLGWNFLPGILGSGGSSGMSGSVMDNTMEAAPDSTIETGLHIFTADVIEVSGDEILVIPLPGSGFWTVADRVTVPAEEAAVREIQPGDQVEIVFTGEAASDSVTGVIQITVLSR